MKRSIFTILLVVLMSMASKKAFASDIAVENEDGIKIYYNYISDGKELEVTAYWYSYSNGTYRSYENLKTLRIPPEVTYSGRKRKVTAIAADFRYGNDGTYSCIYLPATINKIGRGAFCHKEYNSYSSCTEKFVITDIKAFCECGFSDGFVDNNLLSPSISYDLYYGDEETMITHLEVPAGVKYLRGLSCCKSIITLTISNDVESVSECKYMHYLQKVDIKTDKLKHILSEAFYGCGLLNNVIIGRGVQKIDGGAFSDINDSYDKNDNPTTINLVLKNDIASWCNMKSENESGDQGIGLNPFKYRSIRLFSNENTEITDVVIPKSVTGIWEYAFQNCLSLKKVTIPDKVTLLAGAFAGCSNLENVVIGNGIDVIPEYTFYKCKNLKSISWGKDIKSIGIDAFSRCGFTSISLPNGLETLRSSFSDCSDLEYVVIPTSVKSLDSYVFGGCNKLMTVISLVKNNIPEAGILTTNGWSNTFGKNTLMNATLYIPNGTTNAYKATNGWKDFVWIEEGLPAGVERITSDEKTTELSHYSIDGTRLASPQKGINIVKIDNGSTKKILVK